MRDLKGLKRNRELMLAAADRIEQLEKALGDLTAYADGMNPIPPVIYRARVALAADGEVK